MPNIKISKKRVYISKTLKTKLSVFRDHGCTVINAPMGYGKTTILKHYFKLQDYNDLWVNGDTSRTIFWSNLCDAIETVNSILAEQLSSLGFPENEKQVSEFISILRKVRQTDKTVVIIDDYYLIESEMTNNIFSTLVKSGQKNFQVILISRKLLSNRIIDFALRDEIGYICKDDFKFTPEDIVAYFRLNEILINCEIASNIYHYSNGWPFVVKLQMLNYASSKDIFAEETIDAFIRNDIWQQVPDADKLFLLKLCIFDEFNLSQASIQTCTCPGHTEKILDANEYIDYNIDKRTYSINSIYRKYILKMFADISMESKKESIKNAARLYEESDRHFQALCLYYSIKDFDMIYAMKPSLQDMYSYITTEYKDLFIDIANSYWIAEKHGNYDFSIILTFVLFLYNERQLMINLISYIKKDVDSDPYLTLYERNRLYAEVYYANAYSEFNDFHKMNKSFIKASAFTNEPLSLIARQVPVSLGSPSIMALYHNKAGMLEYKLKTLEKNAAGYYKVTHGHGQGFEIMFRAEALYNRGEFEGAQALCHKAIYMSESQNQNSVSVCALMILSRLSIYEGNIDAFNEYVKSFEFKREDKGRNNFKLHSMIDIAKSFLYAGIGEKENICPWLKNDRRIEENTNFIMFCLSNVIYGKYLILDGQYYHFLGISGQFLGLTEVFSYVLPRIYIYIYIAIANNETNESQKAIKYLTESLAMASVDRIYMPFVENYTFIEEILEDISNNRTYAPFIKEIKRIARTYVRGLKTIQRTCRSSANHGLTARETDVAKLAAQRFSNKEIAETLFIAESTVKSNMKMIFNKLAITSRSELKKYFE